MSAITYKNTGVYLINGKPTDAVCAKGVLSPSEARERTTAYSIMRAHDSSRDKKKMRISFDALISHDITYVGIIQTARASGLTEFPLPYVLTNCHNSLCAVGGTINEDDHAFGLSAAKKYGGIYVPANHAVIHQFAREYLTVCGGMVLGSDSHTRYGCYGTMGIGEGGGELVKQLLKNTWDSPSPEIILVWVEGKAPRGIGPHDAAIALVGALFRGGTVKNKVLEFIGPGIAGLSMDFRAGIDVMTTETGCLSSIWETDDTVRSFYRKAGREEAYKKLEPREGAYYDGMVTLRLDKLESMIAMPFHPSKAYSIHELQEETARILAETEQECNHELSGQVELDLHKCIGADGKLRAEQGVIVGCAGGMFENICEAASMLSGKSIGNGYFDLSVYPSSSPTGLALMKNGAFETLMNAGAVIKPAFCGPCFGAGDTPSNGTLSVRHATRNFASREGSKPGQGQIAAVALMDARSIAATALNGGVITAATDIEYEFEAPDYEFDVSIYRKRCWFGFGRAIPETELRLGPNITDWPKMPVLENDLLIKLCAVIHDEVTTTDELIPSGETSAYRSNPLALAEFTLSRRVPEYVSRAKAVHALEEARRCGGRPEEAADVLGLVCGDLNHTSVGSCIFAEKPGDGSAREQAASCQKVLGGFANICYEFATKRYRSNCINWGIVPFTAGPGTCAGLREGDWIYIPGVREGILAGCETYKAKVISGKEVYSLTLDCKELTEEEKQILVDGCLINYYARMSNGKD